HGRRQPAGVAVAPGKAQGRYGELLLKDPGVFMEYWIIAYNSNITFICHSVEVPHMATTKSKKDAVFDKGSRIIGMDPDIWREDICGHPIKRSEHGNTDSEYGWEIDHRDPDGGDDMDNLQPLQWKTNRTKSDNPNFRCWSYI
ncbi:MAG: HNH endonuclease, partial [Hyphomicrobiaceae bacterium]|nr:HNH endonuclease [Hyphomicrobiaceae bacterium]